MCFAALLLGAYTFKIAIFLENLPLPHHGMFPSILDDFSRSKLLCLRLTRIPPFFSDLLHIHPVTVPSSPCRLQASLTLLLGKSGLAALSAGTTEAAVRPGARGSRVHILAIPTRLPHTPVPVGAGEAAAFQVGHMSGTVFVPTWRTPCLFPHDPSPAFPETFGCLPQSPPKTSYRSLSLSLGSLSASSTPGLALDCPALHTPDGGGEGEW